MKKSLVLLLLFVCVIAVADNGSRPNVVILGDSNTSIGGDNCDNPRGWTKWFKEGFPTTTCVSYARSGATWTNTPTTKYNTEEYTEKLGDDNVIYNQINRLLEAYSSGALCAPDIIIIAAGTNDTWFASKRPLAFSKTAAGAFNTETKGKHPNEILSLAESVRYGCEMLMGAFPEARIILLTPLQTTQAMVAEIKKTSDIIADCAKLLNVEVIRQDGDRYVSRAQEMKKKRFTTDGTHTSEAGARRNAHYIVSEILKYM